MNRRELERDFRLMEAWLMVTILSLVAYAACQLALLVDRLFL